MVVHKTNLFFLFILNPEPIGSKAPAFSTAAKSSTYEMRSGQNFSLLCPAQSLPVPAFRQLNTILIIFLYYPYNNSFQNQLDQNLLVLHLIQKVLHMLEILNLILHCCALLKHYLFQYSGELIRSIKLNLFIFIILEPIGSKAPAFSNDATSSSYTRSVGQSFGLLCQAQAFPVAIFRQVYLCTFLEPILHSEQNQYNNSVLL